MLVHTRSTFDKGFRKVFFVVPAATSTVYSECVDKYGADNVFYASATAAEVAINSAIGACVSNANDAVYLMPGSYTLAATIALSKNITLLGAEDNLHASILAPGTAITAITVSATGDYAVIKNITITVNATATQAIDIPASCPGVVVDGVVMNGGGTTTTQVGITNSSDNFVVRNCRLKGIAKGVQSYGANGLFVGNYFQHTLAGGVGIDLLSGNYGVVKDNDFNLSSLTAINVRIGASGTVLGPILANNRGCSTTTSVHAVAATSPQYFNNNMTSSGTVVLAMVVV